MYGSDRHGRAAPGAGRPRRPPRPLGPLAFLALVVLDLLTFDSFDSLDRLAVNALDRLTALGGQLVAVPTTTATATAPAAPAATIAFRLASGLVARGDLDASSISSISSTGAATPWPRGPRQLSPGSATSPLTTSLPTRMKQRPAHGRRPARVTTSIATA